MTLECGIRFLAGDHCFHIRHADQNLDRAHTQFKLAADMEAHWEEMHRIVKELAG